MVLAPGAVVERYEVVKLLGRGGMAEVYLVRHQTLDTLHALKVLTVTSVQLRSRFIREGRIQARLRHPNLVSVSDVLDIDGVPGLLMEYVDGPTLEQWLIDNHPDPLQAERLFLDVIGAVERAHHEGVVHRDLKPANVLLATAEEDGRLVCKVADFGLGKALNGDDSGMVQTRAGVTMGSPSYMAPEQIRDAKSADERADIFALGCILYELSTGTRAFPGTDIVQVFSAITEGRFVPPRAAAPDLPARMVAAIRGCLSVDRERRIPDCATLYAVLAGERGWDAPSPSSGKGATRGPAAGAAPARQPRVATPTFEVDGEESGWTASPVPNLSQGTAVANTPGHSHGTVPSAPVGGRRWLVGVAVMGLMVSVVFGVVAVGGLLFSWSQTRGDEPTAEQAASSVPLATEAPAPPLVEDAVEEPASEPAPLDEPSPGVAPSSQPRPQPSDPARAPAYSASPRSLPPAEPAEQAPEAEVVFSGADAVALVSSAGRYSMGRVPAGTYTVMATFAGTEVSAGRVTLKPGEYVRIACDADFQMCGR